MPINRKLCSWSDLNTYVWVRNSSIDYCFSKLRLLKGKINEGKSDNSDNDNRVYKNLVNHCLKMQAEIDIATHYIAGEEHKISTQSDDDSLPTISKLQAL